MLSYSVDNLIIRHGAQVINKQMNAVTSLFKTAFKKSEVFIRVPVCCGLELKTNVVCRGTGTET